MITNVSTCIRLLLLLIIYIGVNECQIFIVRYVHGYDVIINSNQLYYVHFIDIMAFHGMSCPLFVYIIPVVPRNIRLIILIYNYWKI